MPSTALRSRRWLTYAAIAGAAVLARLPFLLRADRFFDADEAVEALMARHVLTGEHPLFLWGQRYKGVPEVYLTAAVFRAASPSVIAMKTVTLACFVVFLWLNFRLLDRLFSRGVAWIATAFLIAGPPALVLWTLSGTAEIVMTLIAGTVLLLAVDTWTREPSPSLRRRSTYVAAAALGLGLWIQQYILYYVVSLAIAAAIVAPGVRIAVRTRIRERVPAWLRLVIAALVIVGGAYVVLGMIAFFTGGVHAYVFNVNVSATHPQKMWWIAGVALAAAAAITTVAVFRARLFVPALAFLAGYLPAVLGRMGNHGMGAPISRLDAATLHAALPDITHVMVPILFGWRDPLTRPTMFPVVGLVIAMLVAVSYYEAWRRRLPPFFHVFPLIAAAMFFISGSYVDAQSYRYLMPIYAALPVVYAIGIVGISRINRLAGAIVLIVAVGIFVAQQANWYMRLTPDRESAHALECLDATGVRAARAPYWQSYTLTFLSGERIIVSPIDGLDRYAPYSNITRDAPVLDAILARCALGSR